MLFSSQFFCLNYFILLHFIIESFLPVSGEGLLMKVCKKDLRISRDWLGDRWINIKAKPDITSTMFTVNSFNAKHSMSPSVAKDGDSVGFANSCHEVPVSNKPNEPDIAEEKVVCCEGFAEDGDNHVSNPPSEKSAQVDNITMNESCVNEDNGDDDNKDSNDNGDNKDGGVNDNRDMEASGISGQDCKSVELAEVAV